MPVIEDHVDIAAAPADVFRFCHDIATRPDWDERVKRVELLSRAPIRGGTLIQVDAASSGRYAFTWDGEYESFHFPRDSAVRVLDAAPSSPFVGGTEKWEFSSAAGGTRFSLTWDYETRGFLGRIVDLLGRRAATRGAIKRSLASLKGLIENR
jgi:hypothetical protein